MSRSYEPDDDYRPGSRPRDRSPDYYYAGGAPPPSQARLQYEPQSPFYPPNNPSNLQVPPSRHRPRSVPPPASSGALLTRRQSDRPRSRSRSRSRSSSGSGHERNVSPLSKARHVFNQTFSHSTSGLGVGVLGAIVGGLAAREASEATVRARNNNNHDGDHHHRPESHREHQKSRLISTIVGAAVGGLGANALEKRLEAARERDREKQAEWERKWGKDGGAERHRERDREPDDIRRGRRRKSRDDDSNDDDDYDYVYDDRSRGRSADGYRRHS